MPAARDPRAARAEELHVVHGATAPAIILQERLGDGIQSGGQCAGVLAFLDGALLLAVLLQQPALAVVA